MTVMHYGVYCDGPQCAQSGGSGCIRGVRYKCAICPDTDFCASCEASPLNTHNPTHPLIKMKHAIRHVTVSTTDGTEAVLGDLPIEQPKAETVNSATQVQTVAEVKPTEESVVKVEKKEEIEEEKVEEKVSYADLKAEYYSDTVPDGSTFAVGQFFTQTWTMVNNGAKAWPKGISIEFAGGDYMHRKADPSTLNATVLDHEVAAGEAAQFSVTLSATWPAHKEYISYWRLTAPDGTRFGDNIWCSIKVVPQEDDVSHADNFSTASVADAESIKENNSETFSSVHETMKRSQESDMIFPKLPVESPVASIELPSKPTPVPVQSPTSPVSHRTLAMSDGGDLEDIDVSSVGDHDQDFLTDEEYDVLDASDEEEFEECERV